MILRPASPLLSHAAGASPLGALGRTVFLTAGCDPASGRVVAVFLRGGAKHGKSLAKTRRSDFRREALYRVRVALLSSSQTAYGRDWPLSPGMRLTADLVLEDRSFLAWLLDPLLAAQKRAGT